MHKAIGTSVPTQQQAATVQRSTGHGGNKLAVMASGVRVAGSMHAVIGTSAPSNCRPQPGSTASATAAAAQHDGTVRAAGTMHEAIGTSAATQQQAATEQRGIGHGTSNVTVMAGRVKGGRPHARGIGTSAPPQQRAATVPCGTGNSG